MDKKQELLTMLQQAEYVSGSVLAQRLQITRAAVWKYVKALQSEGCQIEAATNRGYRLLRCGDVLSASGIKAFLGEAAPLFEIEVLDSCTSTNKVLKERAEGLKEWHTVIARQQTAGRGRNGRAFFSPDKTGLYMSVLLRPRLKVGEATLITTAAAVAVCRAIEALSAEQAQIKWVNDVYVHGKKVCGILTEANLDMEGGTVGYAVLGVGVNVTAPAGGFPTELTSIAGGVFKGEEPQLRCRLAAEVLRQLHAIFSQLPARDFIKEYRARSFILGHGILVLRGETSEEAQAEEIDEECRLVVRYQDGRREALSSGEVSIKPQSGGEGKA